MTRFGQENGKVHSGTRLRTDYSYGLASLRTGVLDESTISGPHHDRLESLAATLPELFDAGSAPRLAHLWERLGGEAGRKVFREIVIASRDHVHVLEPLAKRPDKALVMVTFESSGLGIVLSTVHSKIAELEGE